MDLVRSVAELERAPDLHLARLLILLGAFAGRDGTNHVRGLTKLAKLDFLLRYPTMLERALIEKRQPASGLRLEVHERASVESRMVRYRFGPWDPRYRQFLNTLVARGLAHVATEGNTISIGLTKPGLALSQSLAESEVFATLARRARLIRAHFDITATNLVRFIYQTFPEVLSLRMNEKITP